MMMITMGIRRRAVLLCMLMFTLACARRPTLVVSTQARSVVIDMQSLGEYPTDVCRMRLTDASSQRVVWEVKGRNGPQIGRVEWNVGENPVAVYDTRHGDYDVVVPAGADRFTLEAGRRYVIEIWGREEVPRMKRRAEFVTPSGR